MSNPARELHEVYTSWRTSSDENGGSMLNVVNVDTPEGNAELLRVFGLLSRMDGLLRRFERDGQSVAVFRRQFPQWSYGAIARHVGWSSQAQPDHVMTAAHMDQIESFANFLDGKVVVLDGRGQETLRTTVARARTLLEEDDSLDPHLRSYISRLLHEIQFALDDDALWARSDVEDRANALWAALRAAEGASAEKGSAWRDLWTQFTAGVAANALTQGVFLGIASGFGG